MELNLQRLFSPQATPEAGQAELDFSRRDFGGFRVLAPVQMEYHAQGENGEVTLALQLKTVVSAECARCLTPFERVWEVRQDYRIAKRDLDEEFPELPYTAAGALDLEELAFEELLLNVDPILLCSENCEGLCQHCGKLKTECGCPREEEGDPRLQMLRQLLDDDSKS